MVYDQALDSDGGRIPIGTFAVFAPPLPGTAPCARTGMLVLEARAERSTWFGATAIAMSVSFWTLSRALRILSAPSPTAPGYAFRFTMSNGASMLFD